MKSFIQAKDDVFTTQFRNVGSGTPWRELLPLRDFFEPAEQFTARELDYLLHHELLARTRLGSMHHICLQVSDIQAGCNALLATGLPDDEKRRPQIGRIRRWLLIVYDPDGARSELMEPRTVAEAPAAVPVIPVE